MLHQIDWECVCRHIDSVGYKEGKANNVWYGHVCGDEVEERTLYKVWRALVKRKCI